MPELKQAMDFNLASRSVVLFLLMVIAAPGVLNTVLMSVTERFREFGISLAMGMKSAVLVRLVLLETFIIVTLGVLVHPIVLGGQIAEIYEDYGFLPQIVVTTRFSIAVKAAGIAFGMSLLAGVYPAIRVFELEPLKGIRYT